MFKISNFFGKLKKIFPKKTIVLVFSALIIGSCLTFGLQLILAWTGPTEAPPGTAPAVTFLNTSASSQTKAGQLIVKNIVSNGADYASNRNSVNDIWLASPAGGGQPKWASTLGDIPFNQDCETKSFGQACDSEYYVVTQVNSNSFVCCKPNNPPTPPAPINLEISSFDVTAFGVGWANDTKYTGSAIIKVWDADTQQGKNGIVVKGFWLGDEQTDPAYKGATNLCEGMTTRSKCQATTQTDANANDGVATINSAGIPSATVYSAGKFCFTITDVEVGSNNLVGTIKPGAKKCYNIPDPCPGQDCKNTHVASITVTEQKDTSGWYRYAAAKVKIVNEAGIPISGKTVSGNWSNCYSFAGASNAVTGADPNQPGIATISSGAQKGCWKLSCSYGSNNPKATFQVTDVVGNGPIWDGNTVSGFGTSDPCPTPLFIKSMTVVENQSACSWSCNCTYSKSGSSCNTCYGNTKYVTVTILDQPVAGVTVTGKWADGTVVTGTTDANGQVIIPNTTCPYTSNSLEITNLSASGRNYASDLNFANPPKVSW